MPAGDGASCGRSGRFPPHYLLWSVGWRHSQSCLSHCALVWEVIHPSACASYGGNFRDFHCLPGLSDFSACCPHSFGEYFEFLCKPELHKNISDVLCYLLPSNMHFTPHPHPPPHPPQLAWQLFQYSAQGQDVCSENSFNIYTFSFIQWLPSCIVLVGEDIV